MMRPSSGYSGTAQRMTMDYNVHRGLCKARRGRTEGRGEEGKANAGNEDQILGRQKAIQSGDRLNRILRRATLLH